MNNVIDFLARQAYYVDHLYPVYAALPADARGVFYALGEDTKNKLLKLGVPAHQMREYQEGGALGSQTILTASYGDAVRALNSGADRSVILMEHGVGLTFGKAAYADGVGSRIHLRMIPVQNQYVANKVHPEVQHIPHPVVGVPKLDSWKDVAFKKQTSPLIVFAFHHGDKNSRPAEVGSAWEWYYKYLPTLAEKYRIAVHYHPSSQGREEFSNLIQRSGIQFIDTFDEVMDSAALLVNDCGSAAYEFCVTGKPVVLMNAPWFDHKKNWGIRFWDYKDIGLHVNNPEELPDVLAQTLSTDPQRLQRERAVRELFPYWGQSAKRMADILMGLEVRPAKSSKSGPPVAKKEAEKEKPVFRKPVIRETQVLDSRERGVLYMAFGKKAVDELHFSLASLRAAGSVLPVSVVTGDADDVDADLKPHLDKIIVWQGESPFDREKNKNFQFRAGRVKPHFYKLTPYTQTLYVDCDVEFLANPDQSFGFLKNWEFVIAQERLSLSQLYNTRGGRWYHDIQERDYTVEQFGAQNGDFPFWNSGVMWWKTCKAVKEMFDLWYEEWLVFEGWDEQKALMRAANRSSARVFVLSEIWNYPHREDRRDKYFEAARLILHEYGSGVARSDAPDTDSEEGRS